MWLSWNSILWLMYLLIRCINGCTMEPSWISRNGEWTKKLFHDKLPWKLCGRAEIWTRLTMDCPVDPNLYLETCLIWVNVKQFCQPSCKTISQRHCLESVGTFIQLNKLNSWKRLLATLLQKHQASHLFCKSQWVGTICTIFQLIHIRPAQEKYWYFL